MFAEKHVSKETHEPAGAVRAALSLRRVLLLVCVPVLVLLSVVFGEEKAYACKCVPSTPEERLQRSSAVFSGEVVDVYDYSPPSGATLKRVIFEVEASWKGISEERVTVQGDGSSCDVPLREGGRYLVYTTGGGGQGGKTTAFRTSVCQGTRSLESPFPEEDLRVLGPPEWGTPSGTNAPEESAKEEDGGGTRAGELPRTGGAGGTALLVLGAGALVVVGCGLLVRKLTR